MGELQKGIFGLKVLSVSKNFELFEAGPGALILISTTFFLNVNFNSDILNFRMTTQKYACI